MATVRLDGSLWNRDGDYKLLLLVTCAGVGRGFYMETDESENVTNVHDSKGQRTGFRSLMNRYDRETAKLATSNWTKDGEIDEMFHSELSNSGGLERLQGLFADESADQLAQIWEMTTISDLDELKPKSSGYQIQTKNTLSGSW